MLGFRRGLEGDKERDRLPGCRLAAVALATCRPAASLADVDAGTHPAMPQVRNPHTALGRRRGRTLWLALLAALPLLPQTRYIYWRDWTLVVTEKPTPHRAKPTTLAKLAEVEALLVGTDMTLRQIATKVGISVATIYRHRQSPTRSCREGSPPEWRDKAHKLLLEGLTPAEVADKVGKAISTLYMFVPVSELREQAAKNSRKEEKS